MEFIFFIIFALVLIGTYTAIRRQIAGPGIVAAIGMLASIITMTLFMLARETSILQGVIMGILIGVLFGGATIAIAWYFHSNELRSQYAANQSQPEE